MRKPKRSKIEMEMAKARKNMRSELLPLAIATLKKALGSADPVSDSRIRASLKIVELVKANEQGEGEAGGAVIVFGENRDGNTAMPNEGPAGSSIDEGEDEGPLQREKVG